MLHDCPCAASFKLNVEAKSKFFFVNTFPVVTA